MANFVYTRAKTLLAQGSLDLDGVGSDIRAMLVMENTTADTEEDKTTLTGPSGFTTLGELDGGGGYARITLTSKVVNEDTANNRAEFVATDITFSACNVGTNKVAAILLFLHVNNDADSVPVAYIDTVSSGPTFPFWTNGGDVTVQWNAEGILQIT